MKLHLFFSSKLEVEDSSIKCLNRADFGDQMKHLKISKRSSRNNIYLNLNIINDTFVCQNKDIRFDELCKDKEAYGKLICETQSKNLLDL